MVIRKTLSFAAKCAGSVFELRDHLTTCVDQQCLTAEEGQRLDLKAQRVDSLFDFKSFFFLEGCGKPLSFLKVSKRRY